MTQEYSRACLRVAVAQICQHLGWNSIHTTPIELLTDVLERYLLQLGKVTHRYSEQFGRTDARLEDVLMAFTHMGVQLPELEDYVKHVEPLPFAKEIVSYPTPQENDLKFPNPDSKEVQQRKVFEYVPEHLPYMHPELNEEPENMNQTAIPASPDRLQVEPQAMEMSPNSGEKRPVSSPGDNSVPPFKRQRLTTSQPLPEEASQSQYEMMSVVMTHSGILSPLREGKVPDTKAPPAGFKQIVIVRQKSAAGPVVTPGIKLPSDTSIIKLDFNKDPNRAGKIVEIEENLKDSGALFDRHDPEYRPKNKKKFKELKREKLQQKPFKIKRGPGRPRSPGRAAVVHNKGAVGFSRIPAVSQLREGVSAVPCAQEMPIDLSLKPTPPPPNISVVKVENHPRDHEFSTKMLDYRPKNIALSRQQEKDYEDTIDSVIGNIKTGDPGFDHSMGIHNRENLIQKEKKSKLIDEWRVSHISGGDDNDEGSDTKEGRGYSRPEAEIPFTQPPTTIAPHLKLLYGVPAAATVGPRPRGRPRGSGSGFYRSMAGRSPARGRSPMGGRRGRPPLHKGSPGRPPLNRSPGRPPLNRSPGRPPLNRSPGRPSSGRSPGRPKGSGLSPRPRGRPRGSKSPRSRGASPRGGSPRAIAHLSFDNENDDSNESKSTHIFKLDNDDSEATLSEFPTRSPDRSRSPAPISPKKEPSPAPRRSSSTSSRSPSAPRMSPSAPRRSPSAPRRSPSAPRRSPLAPRRSPSAPRRSPSAPRRSPHRSPPPDERSMSSSVPSPAPTEPAGSSGSRDVSPELSPASDHSLTPSSNRETELTTSIKREPTPEDKLPPAPVTEPISIKKEAITLGFEEKLDVILAQKTDIGVKTDGDREKDKIHKEYDDRERKEKETSRDREHKEHSKERDRDRSKEHRKDKKKKKKKNREKDKERDDDREKKEKHKDHKEKKEREREKEPREESPSIQPLQKLKIKFGGGSASIPGSFSISKTKAIASPKPEPSSPGPSGRREIPKLKFKILPPKPDASAEGDQSWVSSIKKEKSPPPKHEMQLSSSPRVSPSPRPRTVSPKPKPKVENESDHASDDATIDDDVAKDGVEEVTVSVVKGRIIVKKPTKRAKRKGSNKKGRPKGDGFKEGSVVSLSEKSEGPLAAIKREPEKEASPISPPFSPQNVPSPITIPALKAAPPPPSPPAPSKKISPPKARPVLKEQTPVSPLVKDSTRPKLNRVQITKPAKFTTSPRRLSPRKSPKISPTAKKKGNMSPTKISPIKSFPFTDLSSPRSPSPHRSSSPSPSAPSSPMYSPASSPARDSPLHFQIPPTPAGTTQSPPASPVSRQLSTDEELEGASGDKPRMPPPELPPMPPTSAQKRAQRTVITETVGSFVNESGEKIWICPACTMQDDGSPMIGCDICDDWYHWVCVGIDSEPSEDEPWYCPKCKPKKSKGKRGRKKRKT